MASKDELKTRKQRRGRRKGQSTLGEKILKILSAAAQTIDTFGDFTYNPYPYLYSSLGNFYDKDTINDAVNDLIKRGLVEKDEIEGIRLAPAGADVKKSLYRARQKEWDGKWRVVFFDIPEAQRDIRDGLRFELKKLGFGLWQRSAWVTPFDISAELNAYLQKQDLSEVVQIVVGERFGGPVDQDFAAQIWPLNDLNERYARLLTGWAEELKKESTAEERLRVVLAFHDRYLDILASDPQLPPKLLPGHWVGDDARGLFKKLKSILTVGKPF